MDYRGIYEEWLTEQVKTGKLDVPGFLDDPAVREDFCKTSWAKAERGESVILPGTIREMTLKIGVTNVKTK
jgi:hypothetical protein